jgi:hypothetical protein
VFKYLESFPQEYIWGKISWYYRTLTHFQSYVDKIKYKMTRGKIISKAYSADFLLVNTISEWICFWVYSQRRLCVKFLVGHWTNSLLSLDAFLNHWPTVYKFDASCSCQPPLPHKSWSFAIPIFYMLRTILNVPSKHTCNRYLSLFKNAFIEL